MFSPGFSLGLVVVELAMTCRRFTFIIAALLLRSAFVSMGKTL